MSSIFDIQYSICEKFYNLSIIKNLQKCPVRCIFALKSADRCRPRYNRPASGNSLTRKEPPMRLGIIGLPNSGKTTIFNALTRSNLPTAPVSSGKMEVYTAVVPVPDPRIDTLSQMYNPKKTIYATIIYTDIGGLEKSVSTSAIRGDLRTP